MWLLDNCICLDSLNANSKERHDSVKRWLPGSVLEALLRGPATQHLNGVYEHRQCTTQWQH